jgi:hypothetical protein
MSVCCAVLVDGGCWVGCDSQYTRGSVYYLGPRKADEVNGVSVLHSGSAVVGEVVREALCAAFGGAESGTVPACAFAGAVREACDRRGWNGEAEAGEPAHRDLHLLATDGRRLFELDNDLFVREVEAGQFCAVGQPQHAYGAAFAAQRYHQPASNVVRLAIEATATHCIYVGGEVHVWLVEPSRLWRFA